MHATPFLVLPISCFLYLCLVIVALPLFVLDINVVFMAEHPFQAFDNELIKNIYSYFSPEAGVCIDSRSVVEGAVFFGIPGQRIDGGKFALEALNAGARLAVIAQDCRHEMESPQIIRVANPLLLLQALAAYHRSQLSMPVVAITGSNGKTTTRSLIQAALAARYIVGGTFGNYNNELGLPLSLLNAPTDAEVLVLEMGASHPGDIALLCAIAHPTHGLITNVGEAHLEGFGGIEGVAKAKGELFDYLHATGGTGFVNADDPHVQAQAERVHLGCSASPYSRAMYQAEVQVAPSGRLAVSFSWGEKRHALQLNLIGEYNVQNIIAAMHVALYFNVDIPKAIAALENYKPVGNRSNLLEGRGNQIVADCYNANPSSMRVAIQNFLRLAKDEPKLFILGAMNELGEESEAAHEGILAMLQEVENARMMYVGEAWNAGRYPGFWFLTTEHARAFLVNEIPSNTWILIKGSRSYELETLLDVLTGDE
ncbi:MAG: hypothetical protein CSA97_03020 [Bacteroidetes bacterium]|nr:MAG: hypothetical protein CSA97_03020 [Bacteroidota bacterium]